MQANAYQQYKQQSVTTMTPMEIILKLYGETEKEITRAMLAIDAGSIPTANTSILKAQNIINTLRNALDMKFEVSANLSSMYDYFLERLVGANLKKDKAILEEILPMITELRETFTQINRLPKAH